MEKEKLIFMKNFALENKGDFKKPNIVLDAESGNCQVSGRSLMADPRGFYQPVIDWLETYSQTQKYPLSWDFRIIYFNTGSQKALVLLLTKLQQINGLGIDVKVNWHCHQDDNELMEDVEMLGEMADIPIWIKTA